MNHLQETEGREVWLEQQMAEFVGMWLSLLFLPPPPSGHESSGSQCTLILGVGAGARIQILTCNFTSALDSSQTLKFQGEWETKARLRLNCWSSL